MSKRTKIFPYIIFFIYLFFNAFFVFSQEKNNDCINAEDLCPNIIIKGNNINANKTFCSDCEDDFSSKLCFGSNNTIWYRFYTNDVGGDVTINIKSINYIITPGKSQNLQVSILQAKVACDASTYKPIGNCISNGLNTIMLNATGLPPNETFYLVINGAQNVGDNSPAEASFELQISGTAVSRPIPSITLERPKDKYCQNDIFNFKTSISNCKDSGAFYWYLNDSLISVTESTILSISKLKTRDQIKVSNNCFKSCPYLVEDSLTINKVVAFDVFAGNDTTIYEGNYLTLNGITTADTVRWGPKEFLSDTISTKTSLLAKKTMTYSFSGIMNGCKLSDLITIHVINRDNIPPNSFSPNGDNINDVWEIPFLQDFPNCHIQVYSRWGQTVFETTGYNYLKSWDGKYNGSLVDPGTYFYVIELRDTEINEPIKGSVTIVR